VVHNDIFLQDSSGKEHSYSLSDFNVACREGNELSVIWAIRKGRDRGPYIMVINHTTSNRFWCSTSTLYREFFRRWFHHWLVPVWILSVVVGGVIAVSGSVFGYFKYCVISMVIVIVTHRWMSEINVNRFKSRFRFEGDSAA